MVEAVQNGNVRKVRTALKQKTDPNYCDPRGISVLHWAVQEDHLPIVKLLIQYGANANLISDDGITQLSNATGAGNLAMVQTLVELGAQVTIGTPLHTSIAYGYPDIARYLLDHGADVNAQDADGRTPLFFAAMYGHDDLVAFLLMHGANKDLLDQNGNRAIDEAITANAEEPMSTFDAITTLLA